MTFQSFIVSGVSSFEFGESLETIVNSLAKYSINEIDSDNGTYVIYFNGIEYLFDNKTLCLVQYEISRLKQVYICRHKITEKTLLLDFKEYLEEICIKYNEDIINDQIVLLTESNVKIYFDYESKKFLTALKSW